MSLDPVTTILQIGSEQISAKQQYERQKKLMDIQQANQMSLNQQGQELQLDTWNKTNYPAQMEMLKKAGLNPGLMYAKGGQSGTTGSQGGGSAASGTAQKASPMDITNIMAIKSAIALNEANARKANAEAGNIEKYGGPKTEADTAAATAQAGELTARKELTEVNKRLAEIEEANKQSIIDANLRQVAEMTRKLKAENTITEGTAQSIIQEAAAKAIGAAIENRLKYEQAELTATQRESISVDLAQKAEKLMLEKRSLDQKDFELKIQQFKAEVEAIFKPLMTVAGKFVNEILADLNRISANLFENFGVEQPKDYRKIK